MRSGSDRRSTRGLLLGAVVAVAAACTAAQIEPLDASGQGGQGGAGHGGSAGGASGSGGAGGATAGAGGAAGSSAGAGGSSASAGTGGAGGAGGAAAGTSGRGGSGGAGAGGSAGVGGSGGTAGSGGGAAGAGGASAGAGGAAGSSAGTGGTGGGGAGTGGAGGGSAGTTGGAGGTSGSGGATGVTPTVAGQIVVTELMHDTDVVGDDFGEWFEIYNPDPSVTYDLYGCQIRDLANAHTIAAHLLVPPHAFRTAAIFATGGGFVPDYTYSGIKFDNNGADEVNIWCGSILIDKFAYSASLATISGHSFSLDPSHYNAIDNDNPADYCLATTVYNQAISGSTVVRDYGTPGVTNPPCP